MDNLKLRTYSTFDPCEQTFQIYADLWDEDHMVDSKTWTTSLLFSTLHSVHAWYLATCARLAIEGGPTVVAEEPSDQPTLPGMEEDLPF